MQGIASEHKRKADDGPELSSGVVPYLESSEMIALHTLLMRMKRATTT